MSFISGLLGSSLPDFVSSTVAPAMTPAVQQLSSMYNASPQAQTSGYNTGGVPTNTAPSGSIASMPRAIASQGMSSFSNMLQNMGSMYNDPGAFLAGQQTTAQPATTSNPYGLYQAPGYTQGYVTGAADNPATLTAQNGSAGYSTPYQNLAQPVAQAAPAPAPTTVATPRTNLQPGTWQYEQAKANGTLYNQNTPAAPTPVARTAPVVGNPASIIAANKGLYDTWTQMTNPSNPQDVNSFAKWAALNGYPQLNGESAADQFAAFKAAKAAGTLAPAAAPIAPTPVTTPVAVAPAAAPVAPTPIAKSAAATTTAPIVTPTFTSTGAVKIPTATVTPTTTGYTAPVAKTTTVAPVKPGYVAPSGRTYANWTPKKKTTAV